MALHPRQNSCSLFYHLVILFGSFSISASCKFDESKTNSACSQFGLSIVPLVSNKFGLFQIQLVSNSSCFKFGLFQIRLASNSACFKFRLFRIPLVSNSACRKDGYRTPERRINLVLIKKVYQIIERRFGDLGLSVSNRPI